MKKAVTIVLSLTVLVFAVVLILGWYAKNQEDSASQQAPASTTQITSLDNNASEMTGASLAEDQNACGSRGAGCSREEIARRNSQQQCWVIYNGNYYDITPFITSHPGGTTVFNAQTCGGDITAYLAGEQSSAGRQNTHSQSAYQQLEQYRVGQVID